MVVEATTVEAADAVGVLSALADPARLQILAVLGDASQCVCDINRAVPMAANLLSYHLRVLHQAGLIERARRGRFLDYRLAPGAATRIAAALAVAGFRAVLTQPPGAADTCQPEEPGR